MLAIGLLSLLAAPLLQVSAVPQYGYGGYGALGPAATTTSSPAAPTDPSSTGSAASTTYTIKVGDASGSLEFSPSAIAANVGDNVIFEFHQKNHTATQSSFASPCGQLSGGFDTGFMPVGANVSSDFPTAMYTVTSTKATWFFCAQGDGAHCAAGMVFAINCGADGQPNSFSNFVAAAKATKPGSNPYTPNVNTDATGAGAVANAVYTPTTVTQTISLDGQTWTTTYGSYPGSPDPTPASLEGTKHTVIVGGNSTLSFDPPSLIAKPRDQIVFEFRSKNHTATQSSFASPCSPLASGFDSSFMPVSAADASSSEFPTFTITVNDTAPIWVYCKQTGHCGQGMVFAVNTDEQTGSTHTFSDFQSLAKTGGSASSNTSSTTGTGYGSSAAPRDAVVQTGAVAVAVMAVLLGLMI